MFVRYLPLILRNGLRNRRRSALTTLSIAASFCLLGVLAAMYNMFFLTPETPAQARRLVTRNRISITNFMPISYREKIRSVPGVVDVAAYTYFGGTYKDARELKNMFARFAVDPESHLRIHPDFYVPADQKAAYLRERTACLIGRTLADRLGLKLGDRIMIDGDIFRVQLELVVRAIYDSDQENENLYFHYEYLTELLSRGWGRDFSGMFVILADSPASVPRIAREVDAMFRNSPVQTKTDSERAFILNFLSYLGNVKLFLIAVFGALTVTVVMVSANTMAMSVRERVREVGILKTLGFTAGGVLTLILGESVAIALAGGAAGLALAALIVEALRGAPALMIDLKALAIPAPLAAFILLLAVLVGFASSILPAWTTSRRSITDALRVVD